MSAFVFLKSPKSGASLPHQGHPGAILRAARRGLGLSRRELVSSLRRSNRRIGLLRYWGIERDKQGRRVSAVEWWLLCDLPCISVDSVAFGYSERDHLLRIRGAIEQGTFPYAVTPVLRRKLEDLERQEQAWRSCLWGNPHLLLGNTNTVRRLS